MHMSKLPMYHRFSYFKWSVVFWKTVADESLTMPDILLTFSYKNTFTVWRNGSSVQAFSFRMRVHLKGVAKKKLKLQIIRKLWTRTNFGQMLPPGQCPPNTDNRKFHLWTSKGILHHAGILDQQVFQVLGVEVHLLR